MGATSDWRRSGLCGEGLGDDAETEADGARDESDASGTSRARSADCSPGGWMGVGASSVTWGQAAAVATMGCVLGLGWALDVEAVGAGEFEVCEAEVVVADRRECSRSGLARASPTISERTMRGSPSSCTSPPVTSGSLEREMLLRRVDGAFNGRSRSLPAEDAIERVVVEVALLRRRNLDRALCSRVFKPLIADFRSGGGGHAVQLRNKRYQPSCRRRGWEQRVPPGEIALVMARERAIYQIGRWQRLSACCCMGHEVREGHKGKETQLQRKRAYGSELVEKY